jgi:hypothetical protein
MERIEAFCEKWKVREFALFGSILREDFGPDSDVDVLLSFEEGSDRDWHGWARIEEELGEIFGRKVDVVQKKNLRNPFRRHEILTTKRVVYVR